MFILADLAIDSGLVSLVTGSGGALVVLMMWVRSLLATNKRLETEIKEVSRQSVECITKILERQDREKDDKVADSVWKQDLTSLMQRICDCLDVKREEGS